MSLNHYGTLYYGFVSWDLFTMRNKRFNIDLDGVSYHFQSFLDGFSKGDTSRK